MTGDLAHAGRIQTRRHKERAAHRLGTAQRPAPDAGAAGSEITVAMPPTQSLVCPLAQRAASGTCTFCGKGGLPGRFNSDHKTVKAVTGASTQINKRWRRDRGK